MVVTRQVAILQAARTVVGDGAAAMQIHFADHADGR